MFKAGSCVKTNSKRQRSSWRWFRTNAILHFCSVQIRTRSILSQWVRSMPGAIWYNLTWDSHCTWCSCSVWRCWQPSGIPDRAGSHLGNLPPTETEMWGLSSAKWKTSCRSFRIIKVTVRLRPPAHPVLKLQSCLIVVITADALLITKDYTNPFHVLKLTLGINGRLSRYLLCAGSAFNAESLQTLTFQVTNKHISCLCVCQGWQYLKHLAESYICSLLQGTNTHRHEHRIDSLSGHSIQGYISLWWPCWFKILMISTKQMIQAVSSFNPSRHVWIVWFSVISMCGATVVMIISYFSLIWLQCKWITS